MTGDRIQARVFGEVADRYDRLRPDYPAPMVDDVIGHVGTGRTALEVGAGTGKATVAFAARGLDITALEPDAAMAAVLRQRIAGHDGVRIVVSAFEDHPPLGRRFDLLYSAQAWHWTDPDTRWEHAADLLVPGGTLALFWNGDHIADQVVRDAVLAAHREYAPEARVEEEDVVEETLVDHWPGTELGAHPAFGDHAQRLHTWHRTLSIGDYVALLSTQSFYRLLDEPARTNLFDTITAIGRDVPLTMQTVLYLARRVGPSMG